MDGHPGPQGLDRIPPTGRLTVTTTLTWNFMCLAPPRDTHLKPQELSAQARRPSRLPLGSRGIFWYCSILSGEGASRIPGPIQVAIYFHPWIRTISHI
jgi:hypothetical protein